LGNTRDACIPKKPTQKHDALVDKRTIASIVLTPTVLKNKKGSRYKRVNSTKLLLVLGAAARDKERSVTLNILAVYNKFIEMFIEKTGLKTPYPNTNIGITRLNS
jgi:hypothetical protein